MIPEAAMDAALTGFSNEIAKLGALHKDALRAALEAAAPHMLAEAWDDGEAAGQDNADSNRGHDIEHKCNPYRTTK